MMYSPRSGLKALACAAVVLLVQGCASTPSPNDNAQVNDPIEGFNRSMFGFNEKVDENVLKPVATGYKNVVPSPARTGVTNFHNNFEDAWSVVNSLLQLKFEHAASNTMRVLVNTTLGFGGLLDWGSEMRLQRYNEDLGQTLGYWGVGEGAYVVWPFLGPSTARDSVALPVDLAVGPGLVINSTPVSIGLSALNVVNTRANLLDSTALLDDIVLDKYIFVRDGFLQRRRSQVYDGNPPDAPKN
ncbi:MAG: ABC transporter [Burkholderiales bacterium PBB1]|nr:MAG: ABC transporter [Burkholderiales bacterium PBB1]